MWLYWLCNLIACPGIEFVVIKHKIEDAVNIRTFCFKFWFTRGCVGFNQVRGRDGGREHSCFTYSSVTDCQTLAEYILLQIYIILTDTPMWLYFPLGQFSVFYRLFYIMTEVIYRSNRLKWYSYSCIRS